MKLAVVLGVAQMLVGLLLRFTNAMYEKNMVAWFYFRRWKHAASLDVFLEVSWWFISISLPCSLDFMAPFGNSVLSWLSLCCAQVDFACECVPMFIFMICFFGFMDYMILYKWVTPMRDPPSIINSMIAPGCKSAKVSDVQKPYYWIIYFIWFTLCDL